MSKEHPGTPKKSLKWFSKYTWYYVSIQSVTIEIRNLETELQGDKLIRNLPSKRIRWEKWEIWLWSTSRQEMLLRKGNWVKVNLNLTKVLVFKSGCIRQEMLHAWCGTTALCLERRNWIWKVWENSKQTSSRNFMFRG